MLFTIYLCINMYIHKTCMICIRLYSYNRPFLKKYLNFPLFSFSLRFFTESCNIYWKYKILVLPATFLSPHQKLGCCASLWQLLLPCLDNNNLDFHHRFHTQQRRGTTSAPQVEIKPRNYQNSRKLQNVLNYFRA